MSGLEAAAFLVGVAGLFSSCIDAFGYFKLAQHADKDIEVALLKLDLEKTRLLIWGEKAAVFSADRPNPRLISDHAKEKIPIILKAIFALLTDSEPLRMRYGLRNLSSPAGRAVDYISAKSIAVFQSTASRYWIQKAAETPVPPQRGRAARARWAVYDRQKFQHLTNNLKDIIDTLYELTEVGRDAQDRRIIEDIKSILNISHLSIVEEATEGSYRAYSEAAASTKALTESGTTDRRTLEERLREARGIEESSPGEHHQLHNEAGLDSFCSETKWYDLYVILTSKCRKLGSQNPCDVGQLGLQASEGVFYRPLPWNMSSRNTLSGNALWQMISRITSLKKDLEDEEYSVMGAVLKTRNADLTATQQAYLDESMPLQKLYIYCSPCVCLIHTALTISQQLSSAFTKIYVRPDDRLLASCCVEADRALGLRNILEEVRKWEARAELNDNPNHLVSFLDSFWLDRRLDHLNYETPYTYVEESLSKPQTQILLLGEADFLNPLVQKAQGRIPVPTDIWHWKRPRFSEPSHKRTRFGAFIESCLPDDHSSLNARATLQQPLQDGTGSKRPSSPISRASKRLKSESVNSGGRDELGGEENPSEELN